MAASEYDQSEELLYVSACNQPQDAWLPFCEQQTISVSWSFSFSCLNDRFIARLCIYVSVTEIFLHNSEYLKRDDQILPLRLQQEERRNRMTTNAKDRDRALAQSKPGEVPAPDIEMDMDDDVVMDEAGGLVGQDAFGSKIIVIHPGSQNLRIGLAKDALPKTVPMVIARRWGTNESEEEGGEPKPKRLRFDDGTTMEPEKMFGDDVGVLLQHSKYLLSCG